MICYIVGAGTDYGLDFKAGKDDFVIAADAGVRALSDAEIKYDLAIGDFDSLDYVPDDAMRLPKEKDDTDMIAAVKEGFLRGYTQFRIYGGMGGRIDHTIANIQTLAYIVSRGGYGILCGDKRMALVPAGMVFEKAAGSGYVSVFAYSERAEHVTIKGLKYVVEDITLTNDFPLGVSNEFIGEKAYICCESGMLLVVW